jgi:predicted ATPase
MRTCECTARHHARLIVLTGGPGAGKTAVLELIRLFFCEHIKVLPESAGIVFGGGFPRLDRAKGRRAAQRAIFYVQRELEESAGDDNAAVVLCDRGTIDGAAYWPGPDDLFSTVGTTLAEQLKRYHAVLHLRVPNARSGYNRENPLRIESDVEAAVIDERIAKVWAGHPRQLLVEATPDFLTKAARTIELLRAEVPACCRTHVVTLGGVAT